MNINIIVAVIVAVFLIGIIMWVMGFKNWLVWAVSEAEKVLGSGTGQLKLRYVYDLAVAKFPIVAKLIPFTVFSGWVDSALDVMREMIEENDSIAVAITNEIGADEE